MKSSNTLLWAVIIILLALFAIQTHNYRGMRREYCTLEEKHRAAVNAIREVEDLKAGLSELGSKLDASKNEVEEWRERYRKKEGVNSRLREDLTRSRTNILELTAALEAARKKAKP